MDEGLEFSRNACIYMRKDSNMSSRTLKTLTRTSTLIPAAFLFYMGAAVAGNSPQDLMQQQRNVLAGRTTVTVAAGAQRTASPQGASADAQELARRVILGTGTVHHPQSAASAANARGHGDAQSLARNVLLGHGASWTPGS
jgi:hypothetical protein